MRRPFILLAAAALAAAQSQTPAPPTLRSTSQLVLVDVTVADTRGSAVHGLKAADFRVLENGISQTFSHFEEHIASAHANGTQAKTTPELPPNVYTNFTVAPSNAPLNILLIDTLNTSVDKQANLVLQLTHFLDHQDANSNFAVFELSGELKMLQGFTADPKLLLSAIGKVTIRKSAALHELSDEGLADDVRIPGDQGEFKRELRGTDAMQTAEQNRLRVVETMLAMNQLARYLACIPGRKNLLWYAGSFPLNLLPAMQASSTQIEQIQDPFDAPGAFQDEVRRTVNLLAGGRVVVYPIGANGVESSPMADASSEKYALNVQQARDDPSVFNDQVFDSENTMKRIAAATGGKAYLDFNDLGRATMQALNDSADYYELAYAPSGKQDGSYRKITVRLGSEACKLSYRDGYYAEPAQRVELAKAENQKGPIQTAAGNIDFLHSAMQHGAPEATEILLKVILVANGQESKKLAAGNFASPKCKPPYRLVTAAYSANPGDVTMPPGPGDSREVALEFVAVVYNREGAAEVQQSNSVDVFVKPGGYVQFLKEGIRFQQQIAVPVKGDFFVRVGIHDLIGDKAGAIEVPAAMIAVADGQP
jgi:VWFA-related protein